MSYFRSSKKRYPSAKSSSSRRAVRPRSSQYQRSSTPSRRRNVRTAGYLGIENKFHDQSFVETEIAATVTGAIQETATYGLFCPTQGSGEGDRDGRRARMKNIHIKGYIRTDGASFSQPDNADFHVMLRLVQDKQTNGSQMSPTDYLTDKADLSFRNLEHSRRFKTLWAKDIIIGMDGIHSDALTNFKGAGQTRYFECYKNVDIPVQFESSGPAIADISDNSIHFLAIASQDVAGAPACNLKYESRVTFVG